MANRESFDIDGLMVFKNDLTSKDQDGNVVASVKIPNVYKKNSKEPIYSEQIENVLEEPTEVAAAALNQLDHRVNAVEDIVRGGDYIEVQKLKVTREIDIPEGTIPAAQIQSDWEQDDNTKPDFVKNKPAIPTVNDATLTIQQNDTTVGTFSANADSDKIINIDVPVNAADVNALPDSTKYAASLSLNVNHTTFVVTAQLKDQDGNSLGSAASIDLPLESVVVSGSYDAATKKVVLTLQSGSTIEFSVADLVAGLQSEITAQNPLSADLVTDGTTNKVFTLTMKNKLNGIADGAEVNVQSDWNQTNTSADDYIKNKPNIPDEQVQSDWNQTDNTKKDYIKNKPNIPAAQVNADWNANSGVARILNKPTIPAAQVQADWDETDDSKPDYIKNKPTIPTVNNATLTIQRNDTTVGTFTANASNDQIINIDVPVSASDVNALPSSTKYGASVSISIDSTTYVMSAQLKDQDGNNIGSADTVDLPLESMVVNGYYNSFTKKVVLTLQSGSTIEFSVADLVAGLQSEITEQNPLSADLITDGTANKVFTAALKTKIDNIEDGAEVNVQADWDVTDNTSDAYIKNKPTIPANTSDLTNDSGFITADDLPQEVLLCTMTLDVETGLYSCDKTVEEIEQAYESGKLVLCKYNGGYYYATVIYELEHVVWFWSADNIKIKSFHNVISGNDYDTWVHYVENRNQEEPTEVAAAALNQLDHRVNAVEDIVRGGDYIEVQKLKVTREIDIPEGTIPAAQIQSDWEQTDADAKDYIKNKPTLAAVATSGDYGDLENKPTIPDAQVQADWEQSDNSEPDYIKNKPTIPAAQVNSDWEASSGVSQILNKPTIPTVNNATLTIQKNGTAVDTFTANASQDKTINIIVPTTASDVSALPASTKYAASIDLSINSTTYVMSAQLKDQDGNNIGTADTIDLPLESVVVNGSYNASTKKVVLTLQSGSTIEFSVADLVAGLQSEITLSNKLSADLISEGTFNKLFTADEKHKLDSIADGAEVNVQSDWSQTDAASDDYIKNKPNIDDVTEVTAASLNELNKRLKAVEELLKGGDAIDVQKLKVSREIELPEGTIPASPEQSNWNETDTSSLAYIKNKPTIPAAQVNADWNANSGVAQILNKPTIPAAQVNADWNATSGVAKVLNKPTIPSKTSDITNDSGFITANDVPKEVLSFTLTNNGSTITSDIPFSSIAAAFEEGKAVVAKHKVYRLTVLVSNRDYICYDANEEGALFIGFSNVSFKFEADEPKLYSAGMDAIIYASGDWMYFNKFDIGEKLTDDNGLLDSDLLKEGTNNKLFTSALKHKLDSIADGAEVNVQSDWSQTDSNADNFIKNKPTIPAAQVNSDWNATSGVAQILNKPTIPEKTVFGSSLTGTGNVDNVGFSDSEEYSNVLTATVPNFTLRDGAVVHIRFTNGIKDASGYYTTKSLNVNQTGQKQIVNPKYHFGAQTGFSMFDDWIVGNNDVATFVYVASYNNNNGGWALAHSTSSIININSYLTNHMSRRILGDYVNVTSTPPAAQIITAQDDQKRAFVHINNGITRYDLILSTKYDNSLFVVIDNSDNANNVLVVVAQLRFNGIVLNSDATIVKSPSFSTTDGKTVKAGESMEIEYVLHYYDGKQYALLKRLF